MSEHTPSAEEAEEWRPIPGWPYEASSYGRVRHTRTRRVRATQTNRKGYRRIVLHDKDRRAGAHVARFVTMAFHGPPPTPLHEANHKDGDKSNDRPGNLEWVTRSENVRHAMAVGLIEHHSGEDHYRAKLTQNDVDEIRRHLARGEYGIGRRLAKKFGVHEATISDIKRGRRWATA